MDSSSTSPNGFSLECNQIGDRRERCGVLISVASSCGVHDEPYTNSSNKRLGLLTGIRESGSQHVRFYQQIVSIASPSLYASPVKNCSKAKIRGFIHLAASQHCALSSDAALASVYQNFLGTSCDKNSSANTFGRGCLCPPHQRNCAVHKSKSTMSSDVACWTRLVLVLRSSSLVVGT
jgi:hypothetical protein